MLRNTDEMEVESDHSESKIRKTSWEYIPRSYWQKNRISCWLLHSDFASEYAESFYKAGVDFAAFRFLTDQELLKIGVSSKLTRLKLLSISEKIRDIEPAPLRHCRKNSAPMWTVANVLDWLDTLPFGWHYIKKFEELGIDGKKLVRLDKVSLELYINIKPRFLRRRFLTAISSLSKTGSWGHLPTLQLDSELEYKEVTFGFFSRSYAIACNINAADKGELSFGKLKEIFPPFDQKQIELAMFSYRETLSMKKKREVMGGVKEFVKWLETMGHDEEVISLVVKSGMEWADLLEVSKQELKRHLKIKNSRKHKKLFCDLKHLKKKFDALFTLKGTSRLYSVHYQRFLEKKLEETTLLEKEKLKSIKAKNTPILKEMESTTGTNSKIRKNTVNKKNEIDKKINLNKTEISEREKNKKESNNVKQNRSNLIVEWEEKDVYSWAKENEIAKEYLDVLSGLTGKDLMSILEFGEKDELSLSSLKFISLEETEELRRAIEDTRVNLNPNFEAEKGGIESQKGKKYVPRLKESLDMFIKNQNKTLFNPIHKLTRKNNVPPQLITPFARNGISYNGQNFSWNCKQKAHNTGEIFRRYPKKFVTNIKYPPPPKGPRPPFDFGAWEPQHLKEYLKNFPLLKPYLPKLESLSGRSLLEMDKEKFDKLGISDLACFNVLQSIKKSLSFRDLSNTKVETWTAANVQTWFEIDTEFPQYGSVFRRKNINGKILLQLTHEMLIGDLGIVQNRDLIFANLERLIKRTKSESSIIKNLQNSKDGLYKPVDFSNAVPITQWTPSDVKNWLLSFKFGSLYADAFKDKNIDGKELLELSNETLREKMKIPIALHRDELIGSVNYYRSIVTSSYQQETKTEKNLDRLKSNPYSASNFDYNPSYAGGEVQFSPYSNSFEQRAKKVDLTAVKRGIKSIEVTKKEKELSEKERINGKKQEKVQPEDSLELMFGCSFCKNKYSSIEKLLEHLSVHEKRCKKCPESFATADSLRKHVAETHSKRKLGRNETEENVDSFGKRSFIESLFSTKRKSGKKKTLRRSESFYSDELSSENL